MDADFKPFSLSASYFSCGNYWTRNHTGKIFPEEPAWFNSHLPGRLRILCKAKPQPCGDISVCRSTSADRGQWEGQCHGCLVCAGGWSPRFAAGQQCSGNHSRPEHLGLAEVRWWEAVIFIFEALGMGKVSGGMGFHFAATSPRALSQHLCSVLQDSQSGHSQGIAVWGRGGFHPQALAICLFGSLKKTVVFYLLKFVIFTDTFQCLPKRDSNLLPNCLSQLFFHDVYKGGESTHQKPLEKTMVEAGMNDT